MEEEKLGSELEGGGGGVALISADDNFVSRGEVQNGCVMVVRKEHGLKRNGSGMEKALPNGSLIAN